MKRPHLNLKVIRQLRRTSEETTLNKSALIESPESGEPNYSLDTFERSITPLPRQGPVPIQKAGHFPFTNSIPNSNNPLKLLEDKLKYSDLCNRNLELKLTDKDQKIKKLETTVARLHNEARRNKGPKSSKELQENISRISTMNRKLCLQVQHISNKENIPEAPREIESTSQKHLIERLETQLEKTQSNYEKLLRNSISFEVHTRKLYQANEALQLLLLKVVPNNL